MSSQFEIIKKFREEYKAQIDQWNEQAVAMGLGQIQKQVALECKVPDYSLDTPVVYNRDLDKITAADEIRLIVIGDNPGKDEQLAKNNRYLVGLAGKIGEGFFKKNPELGIDFRKNVIILNKTPVHSAKTAQLKKIEKLAGPEASKLLLQTQQYMAQKTAALLDSLTDCALSQKSKAPELWLVGYSELKEKGIFTEYRSTLKNSVKHWEQVYVFQHFSMNRFTIDLDQQIKKQGLEAASLSQQLHIVGQFHKNEIFL